MSKLQRTVAPRCDHGEPIGDVHREIAVDIAGAGGAEAAQLRDDSEQVLFLKHNLNAQAVASLQGEVTNMESEVGALIKDMEAAIAEVDSFIKQLQASEG